MEFAKKHNVPGFDKAQPEELTQGKDPTQEATVFDHKIEFYNPGRLPENISVDDLLANNYKSTPRNKLIANFCRNIGIIEKYGSGIHRISNKFKEAGLPEPVFGNISDGFQVTVTDRVDGVEETEKVGEKVGEKITKNQQKILLNIKQNKYISAFDMAQEVGISPRKIEENIRKLKEKGILKRVGPAKGGHWVVNE